MWDLLPTAEWDLPRPVASCRQLLDVAVAQGIPARTCLAGTGLTADDLADNSTEVQAGQELAMVRNVIVRVDDPSSLGAEVGMRYNLANTGILGYALLASPTLGDALNVACRFATLTSTFLTLRHHPTDDRVVVEFDDSAAPADVRPFVVARDMFAITKIAPLLIGDRTWLYRDDDVTIDVEVRGVGLASTVAWLVAGTIVSIRDSTRFAITVPAVLLTYPMPAADPLTAASCVAQCEDLLESRRRRRGLAARVRARLIRDPGDMPAMTQIADEFSCTERTLYRRLAAENTSYRALVDEVRETLALALLDSGLTVAETARRLGYSETAAFTRAFVRWRAELPSGRRHRIPAGPLH